jgi:superfamily II DNA/RNA helicase
VGGTCPKDNRAKFSDGSAQIAVGTLGRMMNLCMDGYIPVNEIKMLVIDEADKMITDFSFRKDLKYVR